MISPLPTNLLEDLEYVVCGLEEGMQAEGHTVGVAMEANESFERGWVENDLCRAALSALVRDLIGDKFLFDDLGNGGVELSRVDEGVERRFRLKRATRDSKGLVVTVNSDSKILTTPSPRDLTLFADAAARNAPLPKVEQWVIPYILNSARTFSEVSVARVVGKIGLCRLKLADVIRIPHEAPPPPDFKPPVEDDLDLGEEDERGDETG